MLSGHGHTKGEADGIGKVLIIPLEKFSPIEFVVKSFVPRGGKSFAVSLALPLQSCCSLAYHKISCSFVPVYHLVMYLPYVIMRMLFCPKSDKISRF